MEKHEVVLTDLLALVTEEERSDPAKSDPSHPSFDWSPLLDRSPYLGVDAPIGVGAPPLKIIVPPGRFQFSRSIVFNRPVHLIGAGPSTVLYFAQGVHGIFVPHAPVMGVPGGAGSVIEDLEISAWGQQPIETEVYGVYTLSTITVRRVRIRGFVDGLHVFGSVAHPDPALISNANCSQFYNVDIYFSTRNGLYLKGPDANQCLIIALNASDNGSILPDGTRVGWGVDDQSFLGNIYLSCHTSSNKGGSYRSLDPNAKSLFVGCYAELDQNAADIRPPSFAVGGIMTVTSDTTGILTMAGGALSVREFLAQFGNEFVGLAGGVPKTFLTLGSHAPSSVYRIRKDPPLPLVTRDPTVHTGWFGMTWMNADAGTPWAVCDAYAPEYYEGSSGYAKAWFPFSFMFGFGEDRIHMMSGPGVPTAPGNYQRGTIIINSKPQAGKPMWWACVRASSTAEPAGAWLAGTAYPSKAALVPVKVAARKAAKKTAKKSAKKRTSKRATRR